MNDEIDAAYRAKDHRDPESIIGSIVSPEARAATLELVPPNLRAHGASGRRR